ncbi:AAEL009065-PA [Aedes aegypti]|uniref:AAEL009065-PA n=1 Tax=Aedes aegypti TaxID=7159 RepID=Q16WY6_AEDAE|nr:AAEL009065-PA [Aedes aegypti]
MDVRINSAFEQRNNWIRYQYADVGMPPVNRALGRFNTSPMSTCLGMPSSETRTIVVAADPYYKSI